MSIYLPYRRAFKRFFMLPLAVVLLVGCSTEAVLEDPAEFVSDTAGFSLERLHRNIRILASDEFEGRAPASIGETKTIEHMANQFEQLGLQPGNKGSWYQPATLVSVTADKNMVMSARSEAGKRELSYGQQFMAWTKRVVESSELENSELVFVGYGIVAPEYNWNDYEGLDMAGKTAVILVNDPGYASQDPALFKGNTMTYYGRWTYKYEEAARQGASGAIVVHETGAAGYPWEVVTGGWSGPQFGLFAEDKNMSRVAVEGWVSQPVAETLFSEAGYDYAALKTKALTPDFRAVPLGTEVSVELNYELQQSDSNNVIAKIEGSTRPEETIIFTAHWDHMGKKEGEGDQIFNGAVDNATGTAGLVELAAAFKAQRKAPERSVVFLALTAEESGLLGSKFYADNPIFPLESTVAVINLDAANVFGRTRDVTVVGFGASELDSYLAAAASKQGRTLVAEPTPEKGYYYRSDHFNFAKKGVPAMYAEGGIDFVGRESDWGLARQADYTANDYHKVSDEYDPNWDLTGMLEDLEMYFEVGNALANNTDFPKWSEGSEFKAVREQSRAQ